MPIDFPEIRPQYLERNLVLLQLLLKYLLTCNNIKHYHSLTAVVTILLQNPQTGASFVKTATVMKKGMSFGVNEYTIQIIISKAWSLALMERTLKQTLVLDLSCWTKEVYAFANNKNQDQRAVRGTVSSVSRIQECID